MNTRLFIALTCLCAVTAPAAHATDHTWTAGSGTTDWFTAGNWSPASLPTSSDNALIDTSSGATVGATGATASTILLGTTSGATGSLTISGGGTAADTYGYVGHASGGTGTVTIDGSGSSLTSSVNLDVGRSGAGALTVRNSGSASDANGYTAVFAGSTGTATIDGTGSSWTTSNEMDVGRSGTATLSVTNSGSASDANGYIAVFAGSIGTATIDGAGSSWATSNEMDVGRYGVGTLTVRNGGSVSATNALVGFLAGSTGTATIDGSGSSWTSTSYLVVGSSGTGTLTLSNNGTTSVNSGAGTAYIAYNSGSAGTLNIGAASGSTAAPPGTIDAASVTFGSGTGTLVFNHTSSSYSFAPAISGSGTIKAVAGTTILTGNSSSFTGTTDVSGGELEVGDAGHTGASLGSNVNVTGGTLAGHGTVGGNVSNTGGSVAPGGSIGTLSVSGNYTQGSGGTLSIELDPSSASKLAVSGSAALDGALALTPDAGTYTRGTSYTILTAGSGVSGTFSSVTNSTPSLVQFTVGYAAAAVTLTASTGATNFLTNAATADQRNVATALDAAAPGVSSGPFNTTLNTLVALNAAGQRQALDQLTGHTATAFVSGASAGMRAAMGAVQSRLGGGLGADSFSVASDAGRADEIKLASADPLYWGPARHNDPAVYTAWVQGFGEVQSIGSDGTGPGLSSTMGGGAFGLERQLDRRDRLGFLFAAARSWLGVKDVAQTGTQNTYATGLYGRHDWGHCTADGAVLLAYNHATSERQVTAINETASGTTDGLGAGLDAGLGYRIPLDEHDTTLIPRAGLAWSYSHENGYTETGAPGANLTISPGEQNLFATTLGATLASKFEVPAADGSTNIVRPELRLGWRHDWLDPRASVGEAFAGVANSAFTAYGTSPGRDAGLVGLGASFASAETPTLAFYARYDGTFAANETDSAITAGVRYSW